MIPIVTPMTLAQPELAARDTGGAKRMDRYARHLVNLGEREFNMNNTSILVLGAGELGMAVLRNLAKRVVSSSGTTVTVLLRPSSINPDAPGKQRDVAELRSLGVNFLPGDLADPNTDLPGLFKSHPICNAAMLGAHHAPQRTAPRVTVAGPVKTFVARGAK